MLALRPGIIWASFTFRSNMADSPLSFDLESESTNHGEIIEEALVAAPSGSKSKSKGHKKKASSLASSVRPTKVDKVGQRQHQALERQFEKARKISEAASLDSALQLQREAANYGQDIPLPSPSVSSTVLHMVAARDYVAPPFGSCSVRNNTWPIPQQQVGGAAGSRPIPEATFTPTAAGLQGEAIPVQTQALDLSD